MHYSIAYFSFMMRTSMQPNPKACHTGGGDQTGMSARCFACNGNLECLTIRQVRNVRNVWHHLCRCILERNANAGGNILFRTMVTLITETTGQTGAPNRHTTHRTMPVERVNCQPPYYTATKITLSDTLRLLDGRSADQTGVCRGCTTRGIPESRQRCASGRTRDGRCRPERARATQCCHAVQLPPISGWNSSERRPSYQGQYAQYDCRYSQRGAHDCKTVCQILTPIWLYRPDICNICLHRRNGRL